MKWCQMGKKITDIDELIKARKDELKKLQEKNSIRSLNQSLIFSKNIKIK